MKWLILAVVIFVAQQTILYSEEVYDETIDTEYYNIELKEMTSKIKYWNFDVKYLDKQSYYLSFLKENFREYYNYYMYYLTMSRDMTKMRDEFLKASNIPDGLSVNLFFSRNFKVEYNIGYKFRIYFDSEKIAKGDVEW